MAAGSRCRPFPNAAGSCLPACLPACLRAAASPLSAFRKFCSWFPFVSATPPAPHPRLGFSTSFSSFSSSSSWKCHGRIGRTARRGFRSTKTGAPHSPARVASPSPFSALTLFSPSFIFSSPLLLPFFSSPQAPLLFFSTFTTAYTKQLGSRNTGWQLGGL